MQPILDGNGNVTAQGIELRIPPRDSAYFGWVTEDGPSTVEMAAVQCVFPNPQRNDLYFIVTKYGVNLSIPRSQIGELLMRLGWTEAEYVGRPQ